MSPIHTVPAILPGVLRAVILHVGMAMVRCNGFSRFNSPATSRPSGVMAQAVILTRVLARGPLDHAITEEYVS